MLKIFAIILEIILSYKICNVQCAGAGMGPDNTFCYDSPACGPLSWGQYSSLCQFGNLQSPINFDRSKVTKIPKSVSLVLSKEYAYVHSPFFLTNNGHSVSLSLRQDETSDCLVKGKGFLPNEPFFFSTLHFHWGPDDNTGSEHTINGQAYPLELHMIHKQSSNPSKLAVFGILHQISEYDNPALTPIIENLNLIQNHNGTVRISPGYMVNLTAFLPKKVKVFRYQGSLTTPTCDEGVVWTVFDDIQPVSRRQVMAFRNLLQMNGRPLRRNYRPVQPAFTSLRKSVFYIKSVLPTTTIKKKNG